MSFYLKISCLSVVCCLTVYFSQLRAGTVSDIDFFRVDNQTELIFVTSGYTTKQVAVTNWIGDEFKRLVYQSTGISLRVRYTTGRQNFTNSIVVLPSSPDWGQCSSTERSKMGDEGFLIKASNEGVLITGNNFSSTMYGAFELLQRFWGMRCLTNDFIYVPKLSQVNIPKSFYLLSLPSFSYRRLYSRQGNSFPYNVWNKTSDEPFNIPKTFEGAFQSLTKVNYLVHTMDKLLPASQYFSRDPSLFAFYENKRDSRQPCFSNPKTVSIIINRLKTLITKDPSYEFWGVSANDNGVFCRGNGPGDNCGKLFAQSKTDATVLLDLVSKVAKAIPDKKFIFLAYSKTYIPPKVSLDLPDNVYVLIADYSGNYDHHKPLEKQKLPNTVLKNWLKLTNKIIYWGYYANNVNALIPNPKFKDIGEDFKYYKSLGINMLYNLGWTYEFGSFSELKSYLISRLSWDSSLKTEDLIKEFVKLYFQESSEYVLKYINDILYNMEDMSTTRLKKLYVNYKPTDYKDGFLSLNNIGQYKKVLKEGVDKAKSQQVKDRINKELLGLYITEWEILRSENTRNRFSGQNRMLSESYSNILKFYDKYAPPKINIGGTIDKKVYLNEITSAMKNLGLTK